MTRTYSSSLPRRLGMAAALPLSLLLALGCQKTVDLPPTHPASGRVVYTDGRPLNGGTIQFVSTPPDPSIMVSGAIGNDGRFTLSTLKGNNKVAGAVEGKYEVTIVPPQTDDHQPVMPVMLPDTYTVKAGENTFPDFKVPAQKSAGHPR